MTQDLVKRLSYLRECIDLIPAAERSWYVVDSPWLGSDVETFIISGSPDPHAGTMVCDFQDTDMAGVEGRFSDEEWSSRNLTHAKYIEAADPAQVLELLDALEAKDARIAELEAAVANAERHAEGAEARIQFLLTEMESLLKKAGTK